MKKLVLTIVAAASCVLAQAAGPINNNVTVSDVVLTRSGQEVTVEFKAQLAGALKSDYTFVATPILSDGAQKVELKQFAIQGRRASISEQRKRRDKSYAPDALVVKKVRKVDYKAVVPYEEWMGSNYLTLMLEETAMGCCSVVGPETQQVAEKLPLTYASPVVTTSPPVIVAVTPPVVTTPVPAPPVQTGPMTIADELAKKYSFLVPLAELEASTKKNMPEGTVFDYSMPLNMVGMGTTPIHQKTLDQFILNTRDGSLSIYFKQGKDLIERYFRTNNTTLVELVTVIRAIEASNNCRVAKIIIVGTASPEGSLSLNERLGWDRSVAAKQFILNNTPLKADKLHLYNGAVDWEGLRRLVAASDMYEKYAVLNIIDNYPVWDASSNVGRLGQLMRLNGGTTYKYMLQHMFPDLRNASFIKIYYENKK